MIQPTLVAGERADIVLICVVHGEQSPRAAHLHGAQRIAVWYKNAFGVHQAQRVASGHQGLATNVPVLSPSGSTASFIATSIPKSSDPNKPRVNSNPKELVSIQSALNTNAITLNGSQATCGNFNLHLTVTDGRSFVLLASTNLIDWTPILTNYNSGPTFDYVDTNVAGYGCRFFRIIPSE
jgi:hypothetical protein